MDSRSRLRMALNHKEPDKVPIGLGSWVSGISFRTVYVFVIQVNIHDVSISSG